MRTRGHRAEASHAVYVLRRVVADRKHNHCGRKLNDSFTRPGYASADLGKRVGCGS